jgi:hypothetical protein
MKKTNDVTGLKKQTFSQLLCLHKLRTVGVGGVAHLELEKCVARRSSLIKSQAKATAQKFRP